MKKTALIFISLLFVLVGCERNGYDLISGGQTDPFVGVWKEDMNKREFFSDGTFKDTMNYYGEGKTWVYTGMYSYNPKQQTITFSYDGGTGWLYVVQEVSRDKIVYYDPTDLETYFLLRVK